MHNIKTLLAVIFFGLTTANARITHIETNSTDGLNITETFTENGVTKTKKTRLSWTEKVGYILLKEAQNPQSPYYQLVQSQPEKDANDRNWRALVQVIRQNSKDGKLTLAELRQDSKLCAQSCQELSQEITPKTHKITLEDLSSQKQAALGFLTSTYSSSAAAVSTEKSKPAINSHVPQDSTTTQGDTLKYTVQINQNQEDEKPTNPIIGYAAALGALAGSASLVYALHKIGKSYAQPQERKTPPVKKNNPPRPSSPSQEVAENQKPPMTDSNKGSWLNIEEVKPQAIRQAQINQAWAKHKATAETTRQAEINRAWAKHKATAETTRQAEINRAWAKHKATAETTRQAEINQAWAKHKATAETTRQAEINRAWEEYYDPAEHETLTEMGFKGEPSVKEHILSQSGRKKSASNNSQPPTPPPASTVVTSAEVPAQPQHIISSAAPIPQQFTPQAEWTPIKATHLQTFAQGKIYNIPQRSISFFHALLKDDPYASLSWFKNPLLKWQISQTSPEQMQDVRNASFLHYFAAHKNNLTPQLPLEFQSEITQQIPYIRLSSSGKISFHIQTKTNERIEIRLFPQKLWQQVVQHYPPAFQNANPVNPNGQENSGKQNPLNPGETRVTHLPNGQGLIVEKLAGPKTVGARPRSTQDLQQVPAPQTSGWTHDRQLALQKPALTGSAQTPPKRIQEIHAELGGEATPAPPKEQQLIPNSATRENPFFKPKIPEGKPSEPGVMPDYLKKLAIAAQEQHRKLKQPKGNADKTSGGNFNFLLDPIEALKAVKTIAKNTVNTVNMVKGSVKPQSQATAQTSTNHNPNTSTAAMPLIRSNIAGKGLMAYMTYECLKNPDKLTCTARTGANMAGFHALNTGVGVVAKKFAYKFPQARWATTVLNVGMDLHGGMPATLTDLGVSIAHNKMSGLAQNTTYTAAKIAAATGAKSLSGLVNITKKTPLAAVIATANVAYNLGWKTDQQFVTENKLSARETNQARQRLYRLMPSDQSYKALRINPTKAQGLMQDYQEGSMLERLSNPIKTYASGVYASTARVKSSLHEQTKDIQDVSTQQALQKLISHISPETRSYGNPYARQSFSGQVHDTAKLFWDGSFGLVGQGLEALGAKGAKDIATGLLSYDNIAFGRKVSFEKARTVAAMIEAEKTRENLKSSTSQSHKPVNQQEFNKTLSSMLPDFATTLVQGCKTGFDCQNAAMTNLIQGKTALAQATQNPVFLDDNSELNGWMKGNLHAMVLKQGVPTAKGEKGLSYAAGKDPSQKIRMTATAKSFSIQEKDTATQNTLSSLYYDLSQEKTYKWYNKDGIHEKATYNHQGKLQGKRTRTNHNTGTQIISFGHETGRSDMKKNMVTGKIEEKSWEDYKAGTKDKTTYKTQYAYVDMPSAGAYGVRPMNASYKIKKVTSERVVTNAQGQKTYQVQSNHANKREIRTSFDHQKRRAYQQVIKNGHTVAQKIFDDQGRTLKVVRANGEVAVANASYEGGGITTMPNGDQFTFSGKQINKKK